LIVLGKGNAAPSFSVIQRIISAVPPKLRER